MLLREVSYSQAGYKFLKFSNADFRVKRMKYHFKIFLELKKKNS